MGYVSFREGIIYPPGNDHITWIHGQGCRVFLGDKRDLPALMTESLFHVYINPYGLGLMTIRYYMEIMGVDRPWHK